MGAYIGCRSVIYGSPLMHFPAGDKSDTPGYGKGSSGSGTVAGGRLATPEACDRVRMMEGRQREYVVKWGKGGEEGGGM